MWYVGFALHVCTHLRVFLLWARVVAGVQLPGMATFHMELMAFLLQKRVNSTVMSLGMLLPVWCPRTDVNQCCSRSKPVKAAVGEHLSSKLMVEMWPVLSKAGLEPSPLYPAETGLGILL